MIAVIDYGAGNIQSVVKAFEHIGCTCIVTDDPAVLRAADAAVMPGVGAFGDAMESLRARGLEQPIRDFISSGKPFLGICLGMQILFGGSEESPGVPGLGILQGDIIRIPPGTDIFGERLKIPHIGWNSLELNKLGGLFRDLPEESFVYFVHSYYLRAAQDVVTARTGYGTAIDAAVQKGNIYACQFHPEKSGETGIAILKNFKKICEEVT